MVTWTLLIPQSMLVLGAYLLLTSYLLQVLTPDNSKVAIWFAVVGGFGVGGGLGGWFGRTLVGITNTTVDFSQQVTAQLVGASFGVIPFVVVAIFLFRFAGKNGKGIESKGKNSKVTKVKQVAWITVFAVLGCALAGVPRIYGWLDTAVAHGGGALASLLA